MHQLQKFERGRTYPREGHGLFSRRVSKLSTLPFGSSRRTGSWGRENRTPKERTRQLVAQDKTTTAPAKGKAKPCNRSVNSDAVRRCGSGQKRLVTLSAPIGSGGRARRDMSRRWLKRRRGNVRMPSPSGHHVRAGQDRLVLRQSRAGSQRRTLALVRRRLESPKPVRPSRLRPLNGPRASHEPRLYWAADGPHLHHRQRLRGDQRHDADRLRQLRGRVGRERRAGEIALFRINPKIGRNRKPEKSRDTRFECGPRRDLRSPPRHEEKGRTYATWLFSDGPRLTPERLGGPQFIGP